MQSGVGRAPGEGCGHLLGGVELGRAIGAGSLRARGSTAGAAALAGMRSTPCLACLGVAIRVARGGDGQAVGTQSGEG